MSVSKTGCWLCGSYVTAREASVPIVGFDPNAPKEVRLIVSCSTCGYERNAAVSSEEDAIRLQAHFDMQVHLPTNSQAWWPARAALIAARIDRLMPGGGRVLDIGCNTGATLRAFGSSWQKVGVELSAPLARIARDFVPAEVFEAPIEKIADTLGTFDVVMAHAVIEHLFDPVEFVSRMQAMLRPGGLLLLMTGDRESEVARRLGDSWPLYVSPDHVSFFSARSLRELLVSSGFEIVREEWRFAYFADGTGSPMRRALMKLCEIFNLLPRGKFDMYYVYARMPGERHPADG